MPRQKLKVSDVSYGTIPLVTLKPELLQLLELYFQTDPSAPLERWIDCQPAALLDGADEA